MGVIKELITENRVLKMQVEALKKELRKEKLHNEMLLKKDASLPY